MKNKLFLFFVTISTITLAQDYDFKNYKYRVNGYKALNLNTSLGGYSYFYIANSNYNTSSNNLSTNVNYNRFFNTQKHIKNINYNVDLRGDLNLTNSRLSSKSIQVRNANFNLEDYYYSGNKFTVSRFGMNGDYNMLAQSTTNPYINQSQGYGQGRYEIGLGRGRLEYISDPVLANFILKDMKQKGVIDAFSPNQVETFGKKISQIFAIRMIDYRFRLIDQITMLDSFVKKEITNGQSGPIYFTSLYDNWLYANRFQRFSGKRNEILLGNRSSYNNYKYKYNVDSTSGSNSFTNTLFIAYQKSIENPIRLTLQKSQIFRVELQKIDGSSKSYRTGYNNYNNKSNDAQIAVSYSKEIGWFPNTRTYVTTGARTNLDYKFKVSEIFNGNFNSPYSTTLSFGLVPYINLYYFISPKIKINGYANVNLNYFNNFQPGYSGSFNINNNYGASLAYVFY